MKPKGQYLCSDATLEKAEIYLNKLKSAKSPHFIMGKRLIKILDEAKVESFLKMTPKDMLVHLMNTRKPWAFAESEDFLNKKERNWNIEEIDILGGISFSTTGTHAYNNGAHSKPYTHHTPPLPVNLLFVAGALLSNSRRDGTPDMIYVLDDNNEVNEDRLYELYEDRLLPGLLEQNEEARKDNVKLVINIPGIGCGQFAGEYESEIRRALPRVLKRFFETHGPDLDMVHTVNYDPFKKLVQDEFTTERVAGTKIRLMARPLSGLPAGAKGFGASQLEFPKDGVKYDECDILDIVPWDFCSLPGNDIWKNARSTCDGVTGASTNMILAMFNGRQFLNLEDQLVIEFEYDEELGIAYPIDPKSKKRLMHSEFAEFYPVKITADMIKIISISLANRAGN